MAPEKPSHISANLLSIFNECVTSLHLDLGIMATSQIFTLVHVFFSPRLILKICSHIISSFLIIPYSLHLSC